MKVLIPIVRNPVYSQLIFAINTREVYASQLPKEIKKSQGTIQKHLIFLSKQKYLIIKGHPEKKKNIKLFSVNWEKIIEEFLNFLKDKKRKLIIESKKTWSDEKRKILLYKGETSIDLLDNKNLINLYKDNPYLLILFKESFKLMNQYKEITLKDVFDKITILNIRPLEHWSGWRLGKELRKITENEREKSELKHLESHLKKKPIKFSITTNEEIKLLNKLSINLDSDKEKLKKQDKMLREFDNLMEICFKLSLDPIEDIIHKEIYPKLIQKILENNKLD